MNWLRYTRLSYAETREFSMRRSIVGIGLIVTMCLVAGIVSLLVSGKLRTCIPTYLPEFKKPQVKEGRDGCDGTTVNVGETLTKYSFTYVITNKLDEYRNETLKCSIQKRGATINLLSFAAPQFKWDYQISCSRPITCCPEEIDDVNIRCFCNQSLMLRVQDFSVADEASDILNSPSALNYTALTNDTVANITQRACPNGEAITVLRFDDTSYSAFNSSEVCYGEEAPNATFQSASIAEAIDSIRASVDEAISKDFQGGLSFSGRSYLCYSCSLSHDLGQLLLDLFVAISAIGSITYSLVLCLLKATQREEPSTINLEMARSQIFGGV